MEYALTGLDYYLGKLVNCYIKLWLGTAKVTYAVTGMIDFLAEFYPVRLGTRLLQMSAIIVM